MNQPAKDTPVPHNYSTHDSREPANRLPSKIGSTQRLEAEILDLIVNQRILLDHNGTNHGASMAN